MVMRLTLDAMTSDYKKTKCVVQIPLIFVKFIENRKKIRRFLNFGDNYERKPATAEYPHGVLHMTALFANLC